MKLTDHELRTFAVVADAFFPALGGSGAPIDRLSAGGLGIDRRLPELAARMPTEVLLGVRAMLALFRSRAGGMLLFGAPRVFVDMNGVEQESALLAMASSERDLARQTFKVMKGLSATLLGWPAPPLAGTSPLHTAIGYPGPLGGPPPTPRRLKPIALERGATWTCDVVVVGSGAGGGTAAAVLAKAGLDVVVLERGPYKNESDFTHRQDDADRDLYDLRATSDAGFTILQGRCVGGGTVVNYATSLRVPESIRAEWDRVAGFTNVFTGAELEASLRIVEERISVNDRSATPWFRDRMIEEGCKKLGWDVAPLPRDVKGCAEDERCGYCNFGCRLGAKQSTMRTWLEDATIAGARLVAEADVEKIVRDGGRAVGVRATVSTPASKKRVPLTVFARAVVVACGATFTPILLRRSGLTLPAIGRHLRLHPVTGVWGRFDGARADPWGGVMQARISRQFADLDGEGYGVRFESGAVHPVELMALMPWGGAVDFKRTIERYREWAVIAVLLRDRTEGTVHVPRFGPPSWQYALSPMDQKHVREGVTRAAELYAAMGASEIRAVTQLPVTWRPASGEKLASFVSRLDAMGYGSCQTTYASFHPQGSARMGIDRRASVCDEDGAVHDTPGLYVMDGSCFPTASGVNPMLTIEALAHRSASRLAARLR
jgi:choline dehydrogenase-like flavoprotein